MALSSNWIYFSFIQQQAALNHPRANSWRRKLNSATWKAVTSRARESSTRATATTGSSGPKRTCWRAGRTVGGIQKTLLNADQVFALFIIKLLVIFWSILEVFWAWYELSFFKAFYCDSPLYVVIIYYRKINNTKLA